MDKNLKVLEGIENLLFEINEFNPIAKMYLVNYTENFYGAETKITRKENYNLFVFADKDEAIKYMKLAHKLIVSPYYNKFKEMFSTDSSTMLPEEDDSKIIYKICTKLIGKEDSNKSQTKFFTFKVEEINTKFLDTINAEDLMRLIFG